MPYKSEINISVEQIKQIFADVSPNESISSLNEIEKSFVNPVYDIGLSSGCNFILKINNPTWPLKQHREKMALELVSEQTTIPTPKIIEADFSKTIIPYDYMIMEKMKGVNLFNSLSQNKLTKNEFLNIIYTLGNYLGELHQITFNFFGDFSVNNPNIPKNTFQTSGPFWGRTFNSWKEAFIALCKDNLNWVDSTSFPNYRKDMKKLAKVFSSQLHSQSSGVFVHSDLQPTNIIIDKGKISAIIDFEWSYSGCPNFDFALTKAGIFFSAFPSLETHLITKYFPDLQLSEIDEVFLKGYQYKSDFSIFLEIPNLITFIWLSYMIGSWSWIEKSSQIDEIELFKQDIDKTFSYLIERSL